MVSLHSSRNPKTQDLNIIFKHVDPCMVVHICNSSPFGGWGQSINDIAGSWRPSWAKTKTKKDVTGLWWCVPLLPAFRFSPQSLQSMSSCHVTESPCHRSHIRLHDMVQSSKINRSSYQSKHPKGSHRTSQGPRITTMVWAGPCIHTVRLLYLRVPYPWI